jgi:hypothetical protein
MNGKGRISFSLDSKVEYLGINLLKNGKNAYNENYKIVKKLNKTLEGVKTTYVQALAQLILLKWPKY